MRLHDIDKLMEGKINLSPTAPDQVATAVSQNCSDYLRLTHINQALYRGRSHINFELAIKGSTFDGRKPMTSNAGIQTLLDNAMKERGIAARRGNSVFASGTIEKAQYYGAPYLFIPCNGFHFTWPAAQTEIILFVVNLIIHDVLTFKPEFIKSVIQYLDKTRTQQTTTTIVALEQLLEYANINNRMVLDATSSLPSGNIIRKQILTDTVNTYNFDYDKFDTLYELMSDRDLIDAINSTHEIFFTGEYYAISMEKNEEYYRTFWNTLRQLRISNNLYV